jgi:hypothetical protein
VGGDPQEGVRVKLGRPHVADEQPNSPPCPYLAPFGRDR